MRQPTTARPILVETVCGREVVECDGCGGWRRGLRLGEVGVIDRRVQFDFVDGDVLLLVLPLRMGFDFERKFQTAYIAVIAEKSFDGVRLAFDGARGFALFELESGNIEKVKADVAVFLRELHTIDGLTSELFFFYEGDFVALGLVVDERAVEIGFLGDGADVLGAHGLGFLMAREGVEDPAGFSVVDPHESLTLQSKFRVHLAGALEFDVEWTVSAGTEGDGAGEVFGLHGFDLVESAARDDGLRDDVFRRLGLSGGGKQSE